MKKLTTTSILWIVVLAVCMAAAYLLMFVVSAFAGEVAGTIVAFVVFLVAVPLTWRAWRSGVWTDGDHLVSRSVLRTSKLPWGSVKKVAAGPHQFRAVAEMEDGREVRISASGNPLGEMLFGDATRVVAESTRHRFR